MGRNLSTEVSIMNKQYAVPIVFIHNKSLLFSRWELWIVGVPRIIVYDPYAYTPNITSFQGLDIGY